MIRQKCLFLDRDGVINYDAGYTYKPKDLILIDGIIETCKLAIQRGYIIVIVTNQSGIARGYYTEDDFWRFMQAIYDVFAKHNIGIAKTYFCPYHPDGVVEKYKQDSKDRKPNPGMILQASAELNIDLSKSILIGDSDTDIQAAKSAGIAKSVLLQSSKHNLTEYQRLF
jgi:D-glycero-D-manno-heptose 1,7-bisphosphate phosphatase